MNEDKKVLIVEDDPTNRKILKKLLAGNYGVLEADNGKTAWDMITNRRQEIAAVLLDLIMPVMDGYELLTKIKMAHMDELPIIVTTVSSDEDTERMVLEKGGWDFISKPYNASSLLSRLKSAIERSKLMAYEKLRYVSEHDELTGFFNRNKMFSETTKLIHDNPEFLFVFIRFDIDHFAMYNTSFGEKEGDILLKFLSQHIAKASLERPYTVYGRISADIFCVCAAYDGNEEKLRQRVEYTQQCLSAFKKDYRLEISAGVSIIDDLNIGIEEYYYRASIAAQKCKNQVDNHLAFYDKSIGEKLAVETSITNEMQAALDERQFTVYFQPKFSIPSECPCGAEALVRWIHPEKGVISPGAFIPVFEKNGFVAKLDYYVWEETCIILKSWLDQGKSPFPVSVNISRISLYNPKLSQSLKNLVEKYNLSPALLQLEITESAYMTNPDLMENTIEALHKAGFTILMDDFGSGYSSLNTLKRIKVDVLKIDMKFLPIHDEVERGEIILSSIIKMAKWLGMTVVVEGVETRSQKDFLEGVGCDCIQGYYYSKPVPQDVYENKYLESTDVKTEDVVRNSNFPHYNITILIIEKDKEDANILKACLQNNYHIHIEENVQKAHLYLRQNAGRVRLILIDNNVEDISTKDFLKQCRKSAELRSIPQIVITSKDTVEAQVDAFKHGAYDCIAKPFVTEIVSARVHHVMDISCRSSVFDSVEREYLQAANLDPATKVLTKSAFREMATKILESFSEEKVAFFVIDIDNFKQVNDLYGHIAGDSVLACIAEVLSRSFRKTDLIGRFGGDEFVIMMTKLFSPESAKRKASEIIKQVVISCSKKLSIDASVSIGIAFSKNGDAMDNLFARADQALYQVKKTEKGRYAVYGETIPPVSDDSKPVILVCGDNPQLYPTLALSYGEDASFASITSYDELEKAFCMYQERIQVVCLDIEKQIAEDSEDFYKFIVSNGGGKTISIISVVREGDMDQVREAMRLKTFDMITMPLHIDMVQRRLTRALINAKINQK